MGLIFQNWTLHMSSITDFKLGYSKEPRINVSTIWLFITNFLIFINKTKCFTFIHNLCIYNIVVLKVWIWGESDQVNVISCRDRPRNKLPISQWQFYTNQRKTQICILPTTPSIKTDKENPKQNMLPNPTEEKKNPPISINTNTQQNNVSNHSLKKRQKIKTSRKH